jgi:DNA-binding beta-propeller fold protein YncE
VTSMDGWATAKRGERTAGITAATVGNGYVYVGNRADLSICAVEIKSMAKKGCATLPSSPDGVFYVAPTHEVWVTTPDKRALQILSVQDPAAPKLSGAITLEGEPEGYAVDEKRGIVFTNLEDKNKTLVIDAKTRKVTDTWTTGCGAKGPRGLAVDTESMHLFVACAVEGLRSLDAKGKIVAQLETGAGVDNIDWQPAKKLVYVASREEGKLTVVQAGADGSLKQVSSAKTFKGGRTVMIDGAGNAYIPDSRGGRLFVVKASP